MVENNDPQGLYEETLTRIKRDYCESCGYTESHDPNCPREPDEESDDGNPYCECNEQPYEEEAASNICSACGKLLS